MDMIASPPIKAKPSRLATVLNKAIQAVSWVALAALFSAYILLTLGIIQNWEILTGPAIALLCELVGLMIQQERCIRHCAGEISAFSHARSPRLLTLDDVHTDMYDAFRSTASQTTVELNVLALDLQDAWTRMREVAKQAALPINFQLKMPVITDDQSAFKHLMPAEVDHWIKSVSHALSKVARELDDLVASTNAANLIDVEIRKYSEVPFMHGIAICAPIRLLYVTHCRWSGSKYDQLQWGYNKYRRIDLQVADVLEQDQFEVFESLFKHLWCSAEPAYQRNLGGGSSLARGFA